LVITGGRRLAREKLSRVGVGATRLTLGDSENDIRR
jgi:hypothetical protein